jgi:hemoglobin-like flavoprotein
MNNQQDSRTSLNLDALETSFDLVASRGEELMDAFYSRLFAAAPAVRSLFPDDLRRQKAMLLAALVLVRKSVRDLDTIRPTLHSLGARHVAYGAKPEHYPIVGQALFGQASAGGDEPVQHEHTEHISAPPAAVYAAISDVTNLPRYVPQLTAARPAGADRVEVDARYHGHDKHGETSFHADDARRRMEWDSPSGYRGWMEVAPDG